MSIGKKIQEIRKQKGLSAKQLGDMIHKSESAVRMYESGQREPKIDVIKDIINALQINKMDLLGVYFNANEDLEQLKTEVKAFDGLKAIATYNKIDIPMMDDEVASKILTEMGSYLDFLIKKYNS